MLHPLLMLLSCIIATSYPLRCADKEVKRDAEKECKEGKSHIATIVPRWHRLHLLDFLLQEPSCKPIQSSQRPAATTVFRPGPFVEQQLQQAAFSKQLHVSEARAAVFTIHSTLTSQFLRICSISDSGTIYGIHKDGDKLTIAHATSYNPCTRTTATIEKIFLHLAAKPSKLSNFCEHTLKHVRHAGSILLLALANMDNQLFALDAEQGIIMGSFTKPAQFPYSYQWHQAIKTISSGGRRLIWQEPHSLWYHLQEADLKEKASLKKLPYQKEWHGAVDLYATDGSCTLLAAPVHRVKSITHSLSGVSYDQQVGIQVWNSQTRHFTCFSGKINAHAAALSYDGTKIALISEEHSEATLFNLPTKTMIKRIRLASKGLGENLSYHLCSSAQSSLPYLIATHTTSIVRHDFATGHATRIYKTTPAGPINVLSISPQGTWLLIRHADQRSKSTVLRTIHMEPIGQTQQHLELAQLIFRCCRKPGRRIILESRDDLQPLIAGLSTPIKQFFLKELIKSELKHSEDK